MTKLLGAEVANGGVAFRVYCTASKSVSVVSGDRSVALDAEGDGYFSGFAPGLGAGARYRFQLGERLYPDPASRFQPDGPHGESEVIDPSAFAWSDSAWAGIGMQDIVLYELHVGTFTPEGDWTTAAEKLPLLAELGVTAIEMMPVNEFAGRFGWGYDGVDLFAPTHLYGRPDDLRRFVDRAHALGLGVILDVVYNHFGPDGNFLPAFSKHYLTQRYANEWGEALNFDGPDAGAMRDYVVANAAYWIREFHFDGLRLDATQSIFDASRVSVLAELTAAARAAAGGRRIIVVGENEPQDGRLVRAPAAGGYGLDALWNDDFHHSAMVAATGRREAYYEDYEGSPQELISATRRGFLFQGQFYAHQDKARGAPALDLPTSAFVNFLQNHDQVANSAKGLRLHQMTSPARARALTALLLLAPSSPLLFQGQEFAASAPFLYFADHEEPLAGLVTKGRRDFLSQFAGLASPEAQASLADPADADTFQRCKLDWSEWSRHAETVALHRDLLRLRKACRLPAAMVDGAVLSAEAFALRFFPARSEELLLLVNLGPDFARRSVAEPLFAPPAERLWRRIWSSEDLAYGGAGIAATDLRQGVQLQGQCAALYAAQEAS